MEKKLRSKSDKSGLVLPVSRVHSRMKKAMGPKGRVSSTSPIYLCAVLETIGTEILASAGKFTRDAGRQRISPEDLEFAATTTCLGFLTRRGSESTRS